VRIRLGWLILFILISISGKSQSIPGSVYSGYGFSNLHERSSAYTRALGNTSIGVRNDYNINATNPAALTSIAAPVTSMFEIGTYYGSTYVNTPESSNSNKYGNLQGINYWFRLKKKWATLVGVSNVSSTTYSVIAPRVLGGTTTVPVQSDGKGGINQFYFSNAFDVIKNLSLGVNFSFDLGSVKKSDLVPQTGVSAPFQVEQQVTGNGPNYDFGFQYSLPIKKTTIVFGGTFDRSATLVGTNQIALVNPTTFDTIRSNEKSILHSHLPSVFGGGISVKHKRVTVAADLRYSKWSKAVFDQEYIYQNTIKTSVGFEYRGDFSSFNYLKTISLRAGGWYQDYPILVQGTKLNTWGYTLGVAFPVQTNRATVALNYTFTQLGIAKNELVREQGRYLTLDIIVRDIWGIKRKFD
jgi:hypothetical protein